MSQGIFIHSVKKEGRHGTKLKIQNLEKIEHISSETGTRSRILEYQESAKTDFGYSWVNAY